MLVTPLLAGLLEENQKRMWSFDRFFWEVTNILNKQVTYVFYMNRGTLYEVYNDKDDALFTFKEHVNFQTEVTGENQLLLYGDEHLEEKVGSSATVRGFPLTTLEKPLMLFSIDNNNVQLPTELDLPKFPSFNSSINVESDSSQAKVSFFSNIFR